MPVKSYLAYPLPGQQSQLEETLSKIPECDCIPSTSHDVLVLVTDTDNKHAEADLEARLKAIQSLQCLVLVSGYDDGSFENGGQINES